MSAYVDTGIIVKLYVPESNSTEAVNLISNCRETLVYTYWQEIEVRTALRLKTFRKENTLAELISALRRLGVDVTSGMWNRVDPSNFVVFR